MNFQLCKTASLLDAECLVIGLFENQNPNAFEASLDKQHQELVSKLFNKLSENGDWLWQSEVDNRSLLILHCGKATDFNAEALKKCLQEVVDTLLKHKMKSATLHLPPITDHDADWQVKQMVLQIDAQCYQLSDYKTGDKKRNTLESIAIYSPKAQDKAIDEATAIAAGITLTRTLADQPANRCTPTYLAEQALQLAADYTAVTTRVLDKEQMQAMGMGALLAVGQGSHQPPKLVELTYQGTQSKQDPIVLVGKGITFDSGGLSLKPANVMDEMKYDMSGAATVLGVIKACALLKLPIQVIGLLACAENMPSGTAVKPGDIVKSYSGQTVEIINTDAEGRLVLADALTYAEQFDPAYVIDIATLTGAIIVALGYENTGLMTKDDDLADAILTAGKNSNDTVWRLPLQDAYQTALDSPMADMLNATFDRTAGSITAACFLSRFTKKYRWAHLDIAGTAWVTGKNRQATGRPVSLLIELLSHAAHSR